MKEKLWLVSVYFSLLFLKKAHPFFIGRCTVYKDGTEELVFTTDHVLALTPDNKVKANIEEPMRIVACSVARDPNMSPVPFLMKNLSEVLNSDRNVFFERGYSRRFLAAPDGFNISFHNTLCYSNFTTSLHYQHNVEAVTGSKEKVNMSCKMARSGMSLTPKSTMGL